MSREAFEKWYDKCVADCSVRLGTKAQEWVVWNAGYEAAQQWIPYKEGDSVPEGRYEVTHLCSWTKEPLVNVEYHGQTGWTTLAVTAYRPLPPAFNGDAV